MRTISNVLAGMGLLIGMFLILSRGGETVKIIQAIGGTTAETVKALQGR